jgi:hypothetical protein
MKPKKFEFKVAFSFAVEDSYIAESISKELNRLDIKNYLFSEHIALAENIKKITWEVYHDKSEFAVALISKYYVQKRWSTEEREVMETVSRENGAPYIIPIRIDSTQLEGLSKNIAYKEWKNNASEMAISIWEVVHKHSDESTSEQENNSEENYRDENKKQENITGNSIANHGGQQQIGGHRNSMKG